MSNFPRPAHVRKTDRCCRDGSRRHRRPPGVDSTPNLQRGPLDHGRHFRHADQQQDFVEPHAAGFRVSGTGRKSKCGCRPPPTASRSAGLAGYRPPGRACAASGRPDRLMPVDDVASSQRTLRASIPRTRTGGATTSPQRGMGGAGDARDRLDAEDRVLRVDLKMKIVPVALRSARDVGGGPLMRK